MSVCAIIAAAGSSSRFGGDKLLEKLGSRAVLQMSIEAFQSNSMVDAIVVVTSPERFSFVEQLKLSKLINIVPGGDTRAKSIKNGLNAASEFDYILIHDGARPLVSDKLITDVIVSAQENGAAAPFVPVKDSLKTVADGFGCSNINRNSVMAVQTPQCFRTDLYKHGLSFSDGSETDDCAVAEKCGVKTAAVKGDYTNIKITTREDMASARAFLGISKFRVGQGYDVHKLGENRKLILCGVEIPFEKGLIGHSDADVAAHAAADAVLGAVALRDIGFHFPDSSAQYKGANSLKLLTHCCCLAIEKGYAVANIDITIVAQRPKLFDYIETMRSNIAEAMGIALDAVSVKATTEEGLGFTGKGEGISAYANALLEAV